MALIQCPQCGKEMSDKASKCPQCGLSIDEINTLLHGGSINGVRIKKESAESVDKPSKKIPLKKRLPAWALALIIEGAILLIGGMVLVIFTLK